MIDVIDIFDATVLASADLLSAAIPIRNVSANAEFYFDLTIADDGTATVTFEIGDTEDEVFFAPTNNEVTNSHTKVTNTTGRNRISMTLHPTKFIKFRVTETGTSDPIDVIGKLIIHDTE